MNILDQIAAILNFSNLWLGHLPDAPDQLTALFEYAGPGPEHSFDKTDYSYNIQARTRANTAAEAYALAVLVQDRLNRYENTDLAILQTTPILDIGQDNHNPPRHEYTVNFTVYVK